MIVEKVWERQTIEKIMDRCIQTGIRLGVSPKMPGM
jgi:hypothetical protein